MTEALTYHAWRDGYLVPGRITLAREHRHLPQQSLANVCGTDIEAIDLWEQGAEYPSWDEFQDLLIITGFPVEFFTRPVQGNGALFTVPKTWQNDDVLERELLRQEFCDDAKKHALTGWPTTWHRLQRDMFG